MPIRRINFTGRRRLHMDDVDIEIHDGTTPPQFRITKLELDSYDLPSDALVCVEAYRQTSYMRFACGAVEGLQIGDGRMLEEFDSPEGIRFRVKVTSASRPTRGQLLAELGGIYDRRRQSILAVVPHPDVGQEVFRLDFADEPILLINEKLERWREAVTEPTFVSLVYPAAFRAILTRILHIERYTYSDDDLDDWRSRWLRFANNLVGPFELSVETDDSARIDEWIENAVAAFSRNNQMYELFEKGFYEGSYS